jgi:hypothetical protein
MSRRADWQDELDLDEDELVSYWDQEDDAVEPPEDKSVRRAERHAKRLRAQEAAYKKQQDDQA